MVSQAGIELFILSNMKIKLALEWYSWGIDMMVYVGLVVVLFFRPTWMNMRSRPYICMWEKYCFVGLGSLFACNLMNVCLSAISVITMCDSCGIFLLECANFMPIGVSGRHLYRIWWLGSKKRDFPRDFGNALILSNWVRYWGCTLRTVKSTEHLLLYVKVCITCS